MCKEVMNDDIETTDIAETQDNTDSQIENHAETTSEKDLLEKKIKDLMDQKEASDNVVSDFYRDRFSEKYGDNKFMTDMFMKSLDNLSKKEFDSKMKMFNTFIESAISKEANREKPKSYHAQGLSGNGIKSGGSSKPQENLGRSIAKQRYGS